MKTYYLHISYAYKTKGWDMRIGDCFGIYRGKGIDNLMKEIKKSIEEKNGSAVEDITLISLSVIPERLYRSLYPKQDEK